MNSVNLIGRMVRDPENHTTNTGKSVTSFTIAVRKRIKPQNQNDPDADFFRIKAWNQTADYVSNYGTKGRLVSVSGRLETRKYTDNNGIDREICEVVADHCSFLDRPTDDNSGTANQRSSYQRSAPSTPSADEYDPFVDE